jgi:hypothetical protein
MWSGTALTLSLSRARERGQDKALAEVPARRLNSSLNSSLSRLRERAGVRAVGDHHGW